ncbi:MAG TPA: hypothetical protein EYM94_05070 [Gammaproteobacteria bacterium]|nr:hypothetical protein [Gammaproteobacteria bacterium]
MCSYSEIIDKYGDRCQICGTEDKGVNKSKKGNPVITKHLNIEHQHNPYRIRGLTCYNCNWGLGDFKDDIERMERAIKYLQDPPYKGGKPYKNSNKTYPDPSVGFDPEKEPII